MVQVYLCNVCIISLQEECLVYLMAEWILYSQAHNLQMTLAAGETSMIHHHAEMSFL